MGYAYWKTNRKKLPLALVPIVPLALLTLYQYLVTGNLLYYVSVHFAYSSQVWRTSLFSYPFETLFYAATALKGIERLYWFGYIALSYVVYGIGVFHAATIKRTWSASFTAPFYAFTVSCTGYHFVPRFPLYGFPALTEFADFEKKSHVVR